jgi:hypothetical protein
LAVAVAVTVAVVAAVIVIQRSGTGPTAAGSGASTMSEALPLVSSVGTAGLSTVVLPMGHLTDPTNTFWELFVRPSGATSWTLRTPPGVADNGGLVVDVSTTDALTAGFLPSADLTFSPLARSTDGGRQWAPGQLPTTSLIRVPDGLATGPGGSVLALEAATGDGSGDGETVLSGSGDLSSWHPLVTSGALGRSVTGCRVAGVTAVSAGPTGRPLVGLACSSGDRLGLATTTAPSAGTGASPWRGVGPVLGGDRSGRVTVVRLESGAAGVTGLARVAGRASTRWLAFWDGAGASGWRQSPTLTVPGWTVQGTSIGGGSDGQGVAVLLGSEERRRIVELDGPGSTWTGLPTPPRGTSAVAALAGETDAFVPSGDRLRVWAWSPGAASWRRAGTLEVPIQYGSSN